MANGLRNARTFTDSFIRGFSFIDEINKRRRDEEKLDTRLQEEREQRAFAREQATARGTREQTRFDLALEDRERTLGQEDREREARGLVARGAGADELAGFADTPAGFARLSELRGEDEAVAAAGELNRLTGSGVSGPTGLTDAASVANRNLTGGTETVSQDAPDGTRSSLLAPSRGRDILQSVPREEFDPFDPNAPEGLGAGLLRGTQAQIADLGRIGRGLGAGAVNTLSQLAGGPRLVDTPDVGGGLTGEILAPEGFTTEEEFALMDNPAEVERARQQNQQIVAGLSEAAQEPDANVPAARIAASERLSGEAQAAEAAVTARYDSLLDPTAESPTRELILADPGAAAVQYFQDRSTLQAANPQMAAAVDRQMQPALTAYEDQIKQEIADAAPGSPEARRHTQRLRNVQATAGEIYDDYRPSQAAGINQRGLPVGNQQLAPQVLAEIESPDRPRPAAPQAPGQINAAGTTVNRIKPGSRLNDKQLRAIVRLRDAGLMTPSDAQTVIMTGKLPTTSAAVKLTSHDPTKDLYGSDANGNVVLLRPGRRAPGKGRGKADVVAPNELTQDTLDNMEVGLTAVFPEAGPEHVAALKNAFLDDVDNLSQRFDLRNQQQAIELGRFLGQAVLLNARDTDRRENNWIPFDEGGEPSVSEILNSPQIQNELAGRFDIRIQNVPEVRPTDVPPGVDIAGLRSALQTGDFGQEAALLAEQGSDADVYLFALRKDALEGSQ